MQLFPVSFRSAAHMFSDRVSLLHKVKMSLHRIFCLSTFPSDPHFEHYSKLAGDFFLKNFDRSRLCRGFLTSVLLSSKRDSRHLISLLTLAQSSSNHFSPSLVLRVLYLTSLRFHSVAPVISSFSYLPSAFPCINGISTTMPIFSTCLVPLKYAFRSTPAAPRHSLHYSVGPSFLRKTKLHRSFAPKISLFISETLRDAVGFNREHLRLREWKAGKGKEIRICRGNPSCTLRFQKYLSRLLSETRRSD